MVKVYFIGTIDSPQKAYSKEFCGGPHVTNTKEIGQITLYKFEKIGSNPLPPLRQITSLQFINKL
jgi:alanyl-tRNA synthetase